MSLLVQRHLRTAVCTSLVPLQSSPMPSAAWLLSYGVTTFSAGRSVPMAALSRVRTLHMAHPTIASDLVPEKLLLPQKRVTFIGAPFCEGQNLIGSDLAPMAIRKAGLQAAAAQLGWEWDDDGDLDFASHFASNGVATDSDHLATLARYQEWVNTGMHENFSEWCHKNQTPEEQAAKIAKALTRADGPRGDEGADAREGSKPDEVVNCELIGTGLELVYEHARASAASGAFTLTVGGDHSVGAASIAGVASAYPDVGVIWIDAHADANTPRTSPSMHYHGMPAAHLMGWFADGADGVDLPGFGWFPTGGCIDESRLAYIGLRDIDAAEAAALRASNVHVFTMRDVDKHGIARVVEMAMNGIDPNGRRPLHLSLDIDSVDPAFAPGTGTCARGGLSYREIHYVCEELAESRRLVGMDLVEVNPTLERAPPPTERLHGDNPDLQPTTPTVQLAAELVLSALGKTIL